MGKNCLFVYVMALIRLCRMYKKKAPDDKAKEKKPDYNERKARKWAALLSISTRLAFHKLRDRAIDELSLLRSSMDAIERVHLAQRFDIDSWLKPAYEQLSERQRPLEVWEAEKIGLRTTVLLARAREEVLRMSPFVSSSFSGRRDRVTAIIDSIFFPPKPATEVRLCLILSASRSHICS